MVLFPIVAIIFIRTYKWPRALAAHWTILWFFLSALLYYRLVPSCLICFEELRLTGFCCCYVIKGGQRVSWRFCVMEVRAGKRRAHWLLSMSWAQCMLGRCLLNVSSALTSLGLCDSPVSSWCVACCSLWRNNSMEISTLRWQNTSLWNGSLQPVVLNHPFEGSSSFVEMRECALHFKCW